MTLENPIIPLSEWLLPSLATFAAALLILGAVGTIVGYLITAAEYGPGRGLAITFRAISTGLVDLLQISPRRVWAMTRLAFQESIRRRVLVAFAVFVVGLLFAGWFLDRASDHPARLYLSFVLTVTNYLVIILAIFLSSFSLPNDMKYRTIYTVVTKPVRAWEIVLGRTLGFCAIGTIIILLMGVFSYVFVVRGVEHRHEIDPQGIGSVEADVDDRTALRTGQTTLESHHRHEVTLDAEGQGRTDSRMDHWHSVQELRDSDGVKYVVDAPQGMLQARVPKGGKLRFLDRSGQPSEKGINVGNEWKYRSFIEGGTLAAAIWTFDGVDEGEFPDGLPLELTIRVFRSYKGDIERGILGTISFVNPDPDAKLRSVPMNFTAREFVADRKFIPRKMKAIAPDGTVRDIDLFHDLVHDGKIEVWVQCAERAQYFGMAQADLYLRAADRPFWLNFAKGYISVWLQMVIVTCFGVMFSTFLSGAVAMLSTVASVVIGYFAQFVIGVASGDIEGGGPLEAMVRLVRQMNLTTELDAGFGSWFAQATDVVLMKIMLVVSVMLPNYRGFDTTNFVASGFDIPSQLIVQHLLIAAAYWVAVTGTAYFLFKTREIAA